MAEDVTPGELTRWLTRVETKLDKVANDHEGRLRLVERVMWAAIGLGVAGGATGVGSLIATLVGGG